MFSLLLLLMAGWALFSARERKAEESPSSDREGSDYCSVQVDFIRKQLTASNLFSKVDVEVGSNLHLVLEGNTTQKAVLRELKSCLTGLADDRMQLEENHWEMEFPMTLRTERDTVVQLPCCLLLLTHS